MRFGTADITAMLSAMGQAVTIGSGSYTGVYESPGQVANLFSGGVETTVPALLMASTDVTAAGITHGTSIVTDGTTYKVIGIEPDGTGFTALILTEEY